MNSRPQLLSTLLFGALVAVLALPGAARAEDPGAGGGGISRADRAKLIQQYQQYQKNAQGGSTAGGSAAQKLDPNGNISTQLQDQQSLKNLQELMKKAQQAVKDQQYLTASKLAAVIVSVVGKGTEGLHDNAVTILTQLEDKANITFNTAEEAFIKRDYETATDNYAVVVAQFPACQVYPKARARLAEIRTNPLLASKAAFAEAQKTEEGEDYYAAIQLYEQVIQKYPETAAAVKSKKAIESINTDPEKKAKLEAKVGQLSESELKTRYTLACNYTNAQPKDEAEQKTYKKGMEIFQDIVDHYPNSEYAPKSKEKLDALVKAVLKTTEQSAPGAK